MKRFGVIGSQMDLGSFRKGVDMGPLAIRHAGLIQRICDMNLDVVDYGDVVPAVASYEGNTRKRFEREINHANMQLYNMVDACLNEERFPIVLGGDHSIAIGSIGAVLKRYKRIGVIWVDAHGDFNDDEITPSGNVHGMPLSVVCGCGPDSLIPFETGRVDSNNVAIIGARALDRLEIEKLKRENVSVFPISDIHAYGIRDIIRQAIDTVGDGVEAIHLSFDMDAIDPDYAPGVGTPVLNGLTQREAFIICEELSKSNMLVGIDIVETNPLLDQRNKTGILAVELIIACLGNTVYW